MFSIVPTVLNWTVDLMEIDSPPLTIMQQEAPHPDPPAPTQQAPTRTLTQWTPTPAPAAPVHQAKYLGAHELKLKVAGEFRCPRKVTFPTKYDRVH
jgi:hypothetical protein